MKVRLWSTLKLDCSQYFDKFLVVRMVGTTERGPPQSFTICFSTRLVHPLGSFLVRKTGPDSKPQVTLNSFIMYVIKVYSFIIT